VELLIKEHYVTPSEAKQGFLGRFNPRRRGGATPEAPDPGKARGTNRPGVAGASICAADAFIDGMTGRETLRFADTRFPNIVAIGL
jgi:hypothetical protein